MIRKTGVVDVRYFDKPSGVDFYHVSDGIDNIYFKHIGDSPLTISGIGDGLKFEKGDTEIKKIKPENCKEGLFSPDCVNSKSMLFNPSDLEKDESVGRPLSFEEWVKSLSEEEKRKIVNLED